MRNTMILATAAFVALCYGFLPVIGNNALWLAFMSFMILRGIFQYAATHRLELIYKVYPHIGSMESRNHSMSRYCKTTGTCPRLSSSTIPELQLYEKFNYLLYTSYFTRR